MQQRRAFLMSVAAMAAWSAPCWRSASCDGGFWGERAVITHAHGDHLHAGRGVYHCSESAVPLVHARLPEHAELIAHPWGESFEFGDAKVSLHPAGHILGSAQASTDLCIKGSHLHGPSRQTSRKWADGGLERTT